MVGTRNIHVPINVSGLLSLIPSNDNILYSTFCKVKKTVHGRPDAYGRGTNYITEWISHVLITETGIAFTSPRRKKPLELKYFRWGENMPVKAARYDGYSAVQIIADYINHKFMLTHIKELESYQAFQKRLHYFPELCVSLHKWSRRPEKLQEIEDKLRSNKMREEKVRQLKLNKGNNHEE